MTDLKPCPLHPISRMAGNNTHTACLKSGCPLFGVMIPLEAWQAMPRIVANADELLDELISEAHSVARYESARTDKFVVPIRSAVRAAMVAESQIDVATIRRCVTFFASVIKSGEPWTQHCEDNKAAALAALEKKPILSDGFDGQPEIIAALLEKKP